ncbi:TrbI/VirB10 family protein, partial [Pseudomonas aeruginosa]
DDTPDLATPHQGKVAPEAVALRAQPRPVTRLNRRTLAILVGGPVVVLGATIWSLQPQRPDRGAEHDDRQATYEDGQRAPIQARD